MFCTLFKKLSVLPDFEGFEELSERIDYVCGGLYGTLDIDDSEEIWEAMMDYDDLLEDVFGSVVMSDYTQTVKISHQPDFVPADLESGDVGTHYFGMAFWALRRFIFDTEEQLSECAITSTARLDEPVNRNLWHAGFWRIIFIAHRIPALKRFPRFRMRPHAFFPIMTL